MKLRKATLELRIKKYKKSFITHFASLAFNTCLFLPPFMFEDVSINIALVGNPNSGKSSLFNALTGLNQKVGNFPGVTVEKKTGKGKISENINATFIDLPGSYSLYPRREDEWVSYRVLIGQDTFIKPEIIVLIVDASNLKRNLLFCSQIIDLKIPVVVALSMLDIAEQRGTEINVLQLQQQLGVPVVPVNPRKNTGITQLKKTIETIVKQKNNLPQDFINTSHLAPQAVSEVQQLFPSMPAYTSIHYLINHENFSFNDEVQNKIETIEKTHQFNHTKVQAEEIMQRYAKIKNILHYSVVETKPENKKILAEKLDKILLHRIWGYIILLTVLFVLFQSIFSIAQYPMDWIDAGLGHFRGWVNSVMPQNWLVTDLLVDGILAGLSGILVFIPQIMILFGLTTLLEDTGYMARISFLSDKIMRKVGLNGKSVMPMISGFACAVPAIMSARNIENKKERLLTILITPLMSCSARLPVFTILIALVIPNTYYFGFLSLQGFVMMGLYLLGLLMALVVAYVLKWFIKSKEKSFFILELPLYRSPRWKNIFYTMGEKAKIFVRDAGKIIMVISLILWALSYFGPKEKMKSVSTQYEQLIQQQPENTTELNKQKKAALLENSYAGLLGKTIEPVIKPLGYDWKIGIALISSIAAREVFVGTMATLYSVGDDDAERQNSTLQSKMNAATRSDGTKVYTLATGLSLMLFYLLAMQCMSTLAVVKRETQSWKWPIIQLLYMTGLAYLFSFIAFQLLK